MNNQLPQSPEILSTALKAWNACDDLRRRRLRYKQYTYGNQWNDLVTTPEGEVMTERQLAASKGKEPLTNNMIRQLVKSVVGRFRNQRLSKPVQSTSQFYTDRQLDEMDSRTLEEFLISGCAIQRIVNERRPYGEGVWVDNISPERFFWQTTCDPLCRDVELVGMLHDMSLTEVLMRFSRGSRQRAGDIAALYKDLSGDSTMPRAGNADDRLRFHYPAEGRCRVIEVWTLEGREILQCHDRSTATYYETDASALGHIQSANSQRLKDGDDTIDARWTISLKWHCRYLTPTGHVLHECDSPYRHGEHPFVMKFYPLTDGEIHSFVEDIIDQQRYINRLITLIDHIMGSSAKGVLLFPENQLSSSLTWEDVAQRWSAYDGIIPYRPTNTPHIPQQVSANGNNAGAYELLSLEMKLMEEISGVSKAFQGKDVSSGTAASLYRSEADNAVIALTDIYETFASFCHIRDRKMQLT